MQVSVAEAESRMAELIKSVEEGNVVVITRDDKPIAQITPVTPSERRKPQWGAMRGQWRLNPGWDKPITEEQFFSGDF